MQKSLTLDEYVTCFEEIDIAWCAFIIKQYFKSDVVAFYNAPSKFKEWSVEKNFYKRNALYEQAWNGIGAYNFAGINCKYLRNIFGKNYDSAVFMRQVWDKVEALGYTKVHHGSLKKRTFCAKMLPPQERLTQIFSDQKLVERVINPSSYCNKVKKILTAMKEEYLPDEVKEKIQARKNAKSCNFTSAENLIGKLWRFLEKKGDAGTPMSFYNVLKPIVTDYLYDQLKKFWIEETPIDVQNKYIGGLEENMTADELKTVYKKQLQFVKKIQKQLNSQFASKMFKDELIGKGKDGNAIFKPANERRIKLAREAVEEKIESLNKKLACLQLAD